MKRSRARARALASLLGGVLVLPPALAQQGGDAEARSALRQLAARFATASNEQRNDLLEELLEGLEQRSSQLARTPFPDRTEIDWLIARQLALLEVHRDWDIPDAEIAERIAAGLRVLESLVHRRDAAQIECELASYALLRRDFAQARTILDAALARWPDVAEVHLLRADLLRQTDEWREAGDELELTRQLLAIQQLEDPSAILDWQQLAYSQAMLDHRLGRDDRAALAIAELRSHPLCDPRIRSAAIDLLADVYLRCDLPDEVLKIERECLGQLDVEHLPDFRMKVALAHAARAMHDLEPYDEALRALEDACAASDVREVPLLIGSLRAAELAMARTDVRAARTLLERTGSQLEAWRTKDGDREALHERPFFAALWSRLLRLEGAPARDIAAAEQRALRGYEEMLDDWSRTPLVAGGVGFLREPPHRAVLHEAIEISLRRGGDELALARLIAAHARGSLARAKQIAPPDLSEIRAALARPGEVLLVYLVTYLGSHLFVVTDDIVRHFSLAPERVLDPAIAALSTAIATLAEESVLREKARVVADLLLPDAVRARLRGASLVRIAGADLLNDLAFELLPIEADRPLGAALPVCYLPSLPIGVSLRTRFPASLPQRPETIACLTLGDLRGPGSAARFAVDPAWLLEPFGKSVTTLDLAQRAAADRVWEIPPVLLWTFIGHGIVDRRRPLPAGLSIADDEGEGRRVLWAEQLGRVPPLVVLAACRTAEANERIGEDGASNLCGAALAAGACTVAIAHGDLPFDPAVALVRALHGWLARGCAPATALLRARQELCPDGTISQLARISGLRLHGLGDVPILTTSESGPRITPRGLIIALAVASLVVGAWLLRPVRSRARSVSP